MNPDPTFARRAVAAKIRRIFLTLLPLSATNTFPLAVYGDTLGQGEARPYGDWRTIGAAVVGVHDILGVFDAEEHIVIGIYRAIEINRVPCPGPGASPLTRVTGVP